MSPENVRKADFFPLGPLHEKRNYKRYFYVQRDGQFSNECTLTFPTRSIASI